MASQYQGDKIAESEAFIPTGEEHPQPRRRLTTTSTALVLSVLLAAVLGFLTSTAWGYFAHLPPKTRHCGSSASEAQALGCEFDLLAVGWVPKPCIDRVSNDEYMEWISAPERKRSPFPYFSDSLGQHRIANLEALSRHNGTIWTTSEEHLGHCAQQAKRVHRAAVAGNSSSRINKASDPDGVISSSHIGHCVKMLIDYLQHGYKDGSAEALGTSFTILYMTC